LVQHLFNDSWNAYYTTKQNRTKKRTKLKHGSVKYFLTNSKLWSSEKRTMCERQKSYKRTPKSIPRDETIEYPQTIFTDELESEKFVFPAFPEMPYNLILNIFSHLLCDVTNFRFIGVCKRWHKLLARPELWEPEVTRTDFEGNTLLHLMCCSKSEYCALLACDFLLRCGGQKLIQSYNKSSMTPSNIAAINRHYGVSYYFRLFDKSTFVDCGVSYDQFEFASALAKGPGPFVIKSRVLFHTRSKLDSICQLMNEGKMLKLALKMSGSHIELETAEEKGEQTITDDDWVPALSSGDQQ